MTDCSCHEEHLRRRMVLTGGPGAGKTAVLELLRRSLCRHVVVLPEAAGIVFGGGFPRSTNAGVRRAGQRAIYHIQCELENAADAEGATIVLCDRGTVDGGAYWVGTGDLWSAVGTTREAAMRRYDVVVHLRVPDVGHGYGHQNPLRIESAAEARAIDDRILKTWDGHSRRHIVESTPDFLTKAERAVAIIKQELPSCCRTHTTMKQQLPRAEAAALS